MKLLGPHRLKRKIYFRSTIKNSHEEISYNSISWFPWIRSRTAVVNRSCPPPSTSPLAGFNAKNPSIHSPQAKQSRNSDVSDSTHTFRSKICAEPCRQAPIPRNENGVFIPSMTRAQAAGAVPKHQRRKNSLDQGGKMKKGHCPGFSLTDEAANRGAIPRRGREESEGVDLELRSTFQRSSGTYCIVVSAQVSLPGTL